MRLSIRTQKGKTSDVDISPLIDMVFILLIFFMVTTTFNKDAQVELERPNANSAAPAEGKTVRVFIGRDNSVLIGDMEVRVWNLQSRVRDEAKKLQTESALVVADATVPTSLLIEVVDQCKLAGLKNVGVATSPGGKSS